MRRRGRSPGRADTARLWPRWRTARKCGGGAAANAGMETANAPANASARAALFTRPPGWRNGWVGKGGSACSAMRAAVLFSGTTFFFAGGRVNPGFPPSGMESGNFPPYGSIRPCRIPTLCIAAALAAISSNVRADEGMWTFHQPPLARLKAKHGSSRRPNGCSGCAWPRSRPATPLRSSPPRAWCSPMPMWRSIARATSPRPARTSSRKASMPRRAAKNERAPAWRTSSSSRTTT